APVFVVATANDISELPPEMMRKGRFDEIFFVDLPSEEERAEVFGIHVAKRKRDVSDFDLPRLAAETPGFSGAEIEQAVIDALYAAFDAGREVSTEDIVQCARQSVPLSTTMKERIAELRDWAEQRCRMASTRTPQEVEAIRDRKLL
ncbi:MAG: AAA family ATPase, partial [Armatimonadota bacterium]